MKKLDEIATAPPKDINKEDIKKEIEDLRKRFNELQELLWAQKKYSLLIIFQGMDASGKDGAIKKCLREINPMGFNVSAFKSPTEEELAHDFLWRIHPHTPARGMIQVFNRSHYEDVLFPRVHKKISKDEVKERFELINGFEDLLKYQETIVLKFYLHISKEEQLERFEERKLEPLKMWKYNPGDLEERKLWDDYMKAYEDIFEHCSKPFSWQVVPADKNWYKEYLILSSIVSSLEELKMKPAPFKK